MAGRTLLLVDALAVVYRAFHAIRELSTADGVPTNAVFGFIRMLGQLREKWRPTHVSVVFDGGLPGDRLAALPGYKAQRPPMPAALASQLPLIGEFMESSRLHSLRIDREEADDVIAVLSQWASGEGADVLIASSDKDLYQLVGGTVRMVTVSGDMDAIGPADVESRTGVAPSRVLPWLALVGDSADNIPGVPGIGPKTAASLLNSFGSIEGIYARLGEIKSERVREALVAHRDTVQRNLGMMRMRDNLNVRTSWEELAVTSPDAARLMSFYERMEFHSMARKFREPDLFGG